jgi:hypothetical protein
MSRTAIEESVEKEREMFDVRSQNILYVSVTRRKVIFTESFTTTGEKHDFEGTGTLKTYNSGLLVPVIHSWFICD